MRKHGILPPASRSGKWAKRVGKWLNKAENQIQECKKQRMIRLLTIGVDRLQKQFQGYIVPDSFTHGTSAQRVRWLRKGFETGDTKQGDTFNTEDL